jgi:DNA excision repair protein ERCC-2
MEDLIGFAVMGGAFSEGIDLTGDRLIGAIIVGVGLPQICLERDIIREHFSSTNAQGFEYAYVYPGMNKVLQAAGRVIRTEEDKGIVFLIDERFSRSGYRKLMPSEWTDINWIKNKKDIENTVKDFWDRA